AEASTTSLSGPLTLDNFGFYSVPFTSGAFGSPVFLRADVAGASQQGTPTGWVTFADTVGTVPASNPASLNSQGNTSVQSMFFDAGVHTISAGYGGDNSFNASTASQTVSFTINPGFFLSLGNQPFVGI